MGFIRKSRALHTESADPATQPIGVLTAALFNKAALINKAADTNPMGPSCVAGMAGSVRSALQ